MRYNSRQDLPATIQTTLPVEAQELYVETYNQALAQDEIQPQGQMSQDSMAHQIAWQAVEQEFVKNEASGTWHRRGEAVVEEENPSFFDKIKNLF